MATHDAFYRALRETLTHLYDPTSAIPRVVSDALVSGAAATSDDVRTALIRAIQSMRPDPGVPEESRAWRLYRILSLRYVQHRTQAECAERLGLTIRHLAREQNDAIELLAESLLAESEEREQGTAAPDGSSQSTDASEDEQSQLGVELESLAMHAPGAVTDVRAEVIAIMPLLRQIAASHGVALRLSLPETHVLAALHRSVFRQVLIGAFYHLVKQMATGELALSLSEPGRERIAITLTAEPIHAIPPAADWIPGELVLSHRGDWAWRCPDRSAAIEFVLPSRAKHTVLVVDDNEDLQHYYRRCLRSSAFDLVAVSEGAQVFEAVRSVSPSVIMLDIMLPDVDGWELLRELTSRSETREIPIIICSVIREADLGHVLGAGMYLTKPILCKTLLDALHASLGLT